MTRDAWRAQVRAQFKTFCALYGRAAAPPMCSCLICLHSWEKSATEHVLLAIARRTPTLDDLAYLAWLRSCKAA